MKFAGFPKAGLDFFKRLRKHNDREWFDVHKEEYLQHCRAPMEELVGHLNQAFGKFAPEHITEPKKAVYRIYRDTRFGHDKTPYKTHIAANFPRKGLEKHSAAGFYCSVSDEEIEIGGGLYMPGAAELAALRAFIFEHHAELKKIVCNKKLVELMGPFQGETLQRVPRGYPDDTPARDFLRMKQWVFFQSVDPAIATTADLLPFLIARCKAVAPLVTFLNTPLLSLSRERTAEGMF